MLFSIGKFDLDFKIQILAFPMKHKIQKTDFALWKNGFHLRQNLFFGFHILLGNPKSVFQNPNQDFSIESILIILHSLID